MIFKELFSKEADEITECDIASLDNLRRRVSGAIVVVLIFFSLIVLRLWSLQINHGEEYKNRADSNRVRIRQVAAPRGHILDRKGREIVTNRPSFNVVLMREDSHDLDEVLKRLAPILNDEVSTLWSRVREAEGTPRYLPIRLKEDIDWKTLAYLENHNKEFSGIRIEVQPVRIFHYQDLAANVIGYLGAISKTELESADQTVYRGGDLIGKMGLEKLREADLRGEKGNSYSEVDARGFERKLLKSYEPLPGREIRLTIDVDLQQAAENLMEIGEKSGAVVAMEVKTGRILAIASTPHIRLNDFVGGISRDKWQELLANEKHPLINKTVQATYPPGSTYKMVTALAGLATGVITPDTPIYCPGHYFFGNRRYGCWKKGGHGTVTLKRAIEESCDVYFYQVGQRVGVDGLAEYAGKLGLGRKTGIELEHEKSGLTPTKKWKISRYQTKWQDGETLSTAIGQGFNLASPLQICQMTATVANGGKLFRPQLVEQVTEPDGKVVQTFKPELLEEIRGLDTYMAIIREGLIGVVNGPHGTARGAKIDGITVAGKTGTAQVVKVAAYRHLKEADIPYKFRDHAWFTSFAPAEDPEIAVTVLVEHGLHGGSGAAPIATAVMKEYFRDRLSVPDEEIVKEIR
ncbi:penicillin-binding protein 2 [Desulfoprunum sp.]|jgi:penicillin-binding protein 2|uniref:penicillin-binding protein 2 n=1 Tax=Desulfoprunum sp. TaxID=2020866 RepID=UPI00068FE0F4